MAATPRTDAKDSKNPIQVIERMMKLLDVLSQHPEPLGLKQIAQYTGLHPSTAHRILASMSADRLVDRVEPGSYRLGMRLLELGNLVKSRISVASRSGGWVEDELEPQPAKEAATSQIVSALSSTVRPMGRARIGAS